MERTKDRCISEVAVHPSHTESFLSAVPSSDPTVQKRRIVLYGAPPTPLDLPDMQMLAIGHRIACHPPREEFKAFDPVIAIMAAS